MIYMRNITITTAKSATYLENVGLIHSGQLDRNNEMFLSSERLMLSLGDIAHRAFYANTGSTIAALAADYRR